MYPPGSGYPPNIFDIAVTCSDLGAQLDFTVNKAISGSTCRVVLLDQAQARVWSGGFGVDKNAQGFSVTGLGDGIYTIQADNGEAQDEQAVDVSCGVVPPGTLRLAVDHTDQLAAGEGSITLTPTGGTNPIYVEVVDLSLSRGTTGGTAETFPAIPPGTYTVRATSGSQIVTSSVTVLAYSAPVSGCADEYADNYDPAATTADDSCTYSVRWRAAWQPMAVQVPAVAGQVKAFIEAELRIGFREGHPLNLLRPLGEPLELRATVGPDGYATFRLGPYLQAALGAADGFEGYRLDINEQTVDDAYIGYELRRTSGELLEQGYALNAAVPEAQLFDGAVLSSFTRVPVWPGYSWKRPKLASRSAGRYGAIDEVYPASIALPCPSNPLPVAWLNSRGSWDFWVFQGRTQLGDTVGDGQQFREATTGQQRYSDPGDAYETFKASSGVFAGDDLLRGLRTLWRSPQAWYQPEAGGDWVPIIVERGSRDVGRLGVRRQEAVLSFQTATPEFSQGQ